MCSPFHGVINGLPPLFMTWAATEMLAWECGQLFDRAMAEGVLVMKSVSPLGCHAFPLYECPESSEEIARAAARVGRRVFWKACKDARPVDR